MSPTRSAELPTCPLTPARTTVLRQLDLGLGQRGFGAGLLGREQRRRSSLSAACFAGRRRQLIAPRRPFELDLEPFDVAECNAARIALAAAPAWFPVRPRSAGAWLLASCSWPSAFTMSARATTISASTSAILRRAVSTAASCFELSSLKIGAPLAIGPFMPTIDLRDPPVRLRNDRDGPEEQRDVGRGRVVVEDQS